MQSQKWSMNMTSSAVCHVSETYHNVGRIVSASISAVSPLELVSNAVSFDADTSVLTVADHKYPIDK